MPIQPISATDYVSLDQLTGGGGKLAVTKLGRNPAQGPTTESVQNSQPAKIKKVALQNPANAPSIRDVSSDNPANFPSIQDVTNASPVGKRLNTSL